MTAIYLFPPVHGGVNKVQYRMGPNSAQDAASPDSRVYERSMNAIRSIVRAQRINTRAIELKMGISLAQLFVLQQLAERPSDSLNDLAERTATHQTSASVGGHQRPHRDRCPPRRSRALDRCADNDPKAADHRSLAHVRRRAE